MRCKVLCMLLGSVLCCSWGSALYAAPRASAANTIDVVIERALSESPLVAQIESSIAAERATGLNIDALENPTLDSEVRFPKQYDTERGADEVSVSLSQPFRLSDLGSRSRVNRLIQRVLDEDKKIELLALSQRIKLAYTKAWVLDRRMQEISKYRETTERLEQAILRATEGGLVAGSEGLLFKAEARKARLELDMVASDGRRARAELSKIAGFAVEGSLQRPHLSKAPTLEQLLSGHSVFPAQARAKLALELAKYQEEQAALDAYPRFAPRLIYERSNDSKDFYGVGLSIELPLFNRNEGERLARSAQRRSAARLAEYVSTDDYRGEVESLLSNIRASTAFLAGYEEEILPTLHTALTQEERLFVEGKGSSARLWQVLRELSTAQFEFLERFARLYSDRIELVTVTGTDV